MNTIRSAALWLTIAAALITGCTIQPDDEPRAIPIEQRGQFGARPTGGAAAGTNRIFLVAASGDGKTRLRSVLRDVVNDPEKILQSLLDGPNSSEEESGLISFLPEELGLISAQTRGRDLTIDITDSFDELTPDALRFAVAQLVITASEIDGVENVRLRIDGENQVWPLGGTGSTDQLLTAYDYPGFVESSQPPLPGFPTAIG